MHTFCLVCIGQWRKQSNNGCPVCRTAIKSIAKNHQVDSVVDVLVKGMTQEQQSHRRELTQQHTEALEANPELGTLMTPTLLPAVDSTTLSRLVNDSRDGVPFSLSVLEEIQRTRNVVLRCQKELIQRRQEEFSNRYGLVNPPRNSDAAHYRARAQHHRELVRLFSIFQCILMELHGCVMKLPIKVF